MNVSISQALATGLPVIATRHSGFPEQVIDGVNGFLVPEGNPQALADAIIKMIEHPELWAQFGRAGREHVIKNYNADTLMDKQVEIYKSLINDF